MRRTLALALGLTAVLAAGTATAAHVLRPSDQTQQQIWSVGAEETGKVESAETTLGYLGTRKDATFRYPGADYVKVHFTRLALLPGDYLTVSRPDGGEIQRYDGKLLEGVTDTVSNVVNGSGGKWAMSITGDTAVVRLHLAHDLLGLRSDLARLGVTVDKVARGMTAAERRAKKADDARKREAARPGREESVCGGDDKADAVCYKTTDPVMYQRSKAVARLLIKGTELCTAWRVGPDNRMITNHHCFTTDAEAADTEVWFNYACAQCGGYDVFKPTKVWA
ncbi:MAG: serine protease, partial [Hamadaea sp.]|nr:serine protease [Hamadaea sp.]